MFKIKAQNQEKINEAPTSTTDITEVDSLKDKPSAKRNDIFIYSGF